MTENMNIPENLHSTIDCKQGAVRCVRYNIDGNYILTCGSDKTVKLWNPTSKSILKSYTGHGYEVFEARGSCDNSQIVSGGADKVLFIWDVSTGAAVRKFRTHLGAINCVCFNEESTLAISGSVDGTVRCFDLKSKTRNEEIQKLDDFKDSVTSLDVSDHEILATSVDGKVRRYDLRMGQLSTDDMGVSVTCATFTGDGQCILVSSMDDSQKLCQKTESIKLFDKSSGQLLQQYEGHVNVSYRVESMLNNKDDHVISGSELDGLIHVWDLIDGKEVQKLEALSSVVSSETSKTTFHSLSFHPTTCEMVSACSNGKVYIWK